MNDVSRPTHQHASCQRAREDAAVAILTRSAPDADLLAHLEQCPSCGEEFADLVALRSLLEAAREHVEVPPPEPDPSLLDRLLVAVARQRRRRRLATTGLVLAAAVAVAIAVVAPVHLLGLGTGRTSAAATTTGVPSAGADPEESQEPPPVGPVVAQGSAVDRSTGALAYVSVRRSATGGSAVRVEVEGVAAGTQCHLVLHSGSGNQAEVGHWTAMAGENTYSETVTTPAADLRRVEVLDGGGHRLVEVPLATV